MPFVHTKSSIVKDVMSPNPAVVNPSDTIFEAARIMTDHGVSGLPVVDDRNVLVGVVTRTDLLRRCLEGPSGTGLGSFVELIAEGFSRRGEAGDDLSPVEDFMSTTIVTCVPHDLIDEISVRMTEAHVHRVIVVNKAREPVGIVSSLDLLRHYLEE